MGVKRIEFIDIAKGIGIILVIIGHCIDRQNLLSKWISSFHMPLFFIISGICFQNTKYQSFLLFFRKRFKTLLLPCFYFSILDSIITTITSGVPTYKDLVFRLPGALWFVLILFLTELIYYYIIKINKNTYILIITLILSLSIGIILNREGIKFSYSLCSTFVGIFYYGLGNISKSIIIRLIEEKDKIQLIISLIMLGVPLLIIMVSFQNWRID